MKHALLLVCLSCSSLAGNSFTGSLERVGASSVSIRLSDRRIIDALLPNTPPLEAEAVAAQYQWGDLVAVECAPIPPVFEEGTARYQSLQVISMRLVRHPSPE